MAAASVVMPAIFPWKGLAGSLPPPFFLLFCCNAIIIYGFYFRCCRQPEDREGKRGHVGHRRESAQITFLPRLEVTSPHPKAAWPVGEPQSPGGP